MRQYKAKTIGSNEWVYGDRVKGASGKVYIFDYSQGLEGGRISEVKPDTVCQFTGVKDFYEGDKFKDESGYLVIEWNKEEARFQVNVYDYPISYGEGSQEVFGDNIERVDENVIEVSLIEDWELLGNIHD